MKPVIRAGRSRRPAMTLIIVCSSVMGLAAFALGEPAPADPVMSSGASQSSDDHRLLFIQAWDDLNFLISEPDFYLTVGGLGMMPSLLNRPFAMESPEFTELWGPSTFADNLFEVGESVGDGKFPVALAVSTWGIGKISGSSRLSRFGTDLLRVQTMNGLFTAVLKGTTNRTRPDGAAYSYPSGHTSSAFATAGVVYRHFGRTWGTPAFVLAGYVGLSRLQEGKHFLTDIFAGGILGSYIALKLTGSRGRRGPISIVPLKLNDGPGLGLSLRF